MRIILLLPFALLFITACHNANTARTFCDTVCKSDSISFKGDAKFNQSLSISIKSCIPDSLTWTYGKLKTSRQVQLTDFLNQNVKLNPSAVSVAFQDTSYAWLAFNDCISGRGYLLKLPYNKSNDIQKITGALNSFDPKFSVAPDLRAYTDRGSIYVVDVTNGKEAQMTFKEEYPIDFNDIHKVLDSVNVTKQKIYVKLIKNGSEVPIEKQIAL